MAQHDVVAFGVALCLFKLDAAHTRAWPPRHLWTRARSAWRSRSPRARKVGPLVGGAGAWACSGRVGWRRAAWGLLSLTPRCYWPLLVAGAMALVRAPTGRDARSSSKCTRRLHAVEGSLSREPWVGAAGLLVSPEPRAARVQPGRDHRADWLDSRVARPCPTTAWAGRSAPLVPAVCGVRELHRVVGRAHLRTTLSPGLRAAPDAGGGHRTRPRAAFPNPRAQCMRRCCRCGPSWQPAPAHFFPDNWNTSPNEIDKNHSPVVGLARSRKSCVRGTRAPSPQNFNLFNWTS